MGPEARIVVGSALWRDLALELWRRTQGCHESGAFLLGREERGTRVATNVVYYDQLDPKAYDTGVCVLGADAFGRLWNRCTELGLSVVADAHVHFRTAVQSKADKRHPMIATPGHLAIIFPDMARPPVRLRSLGIYEYLGGFRWRSLGGHHTWRAIELKENE